MNFDKYIHPCNHFHYEATDHLHHPKKFFLPLWSQLQIMETICVLSITADFFFIISVLVKYTYIYRYR